VVAQKHLAFQYTFRRINKLVEDATSFGAFMIVASGASITNPWKTLLNVSIEALLRIACLLAIDSKRLGKLFE
jgi:hypothetical protein